MNQMMAGGIKVISNTIPIQVTPVKNDTVSVDRGEKIVQKVRLVVIFESFLGINRLYLLNYRRLILWLNYLLSALLITINVFYTAEHQKNKGASYNVVLHTACTEYICLVIISMLTKKSSFRNFYADLSSFDERMNLSDDLNLTSPSARVWGWIIASVLYTLIEFFIQWFISEIPNYSFALTYFALLARDCEQIYFFSLLRMILMRVYVIKAHVMKTFSNNTREAERKFSKVEALSKKVQLDISSLHRNYELLHKCSEQLNSIMSLPIMLMLFCSGLSTTMLLRFIFKSLQNINEVKAKSIIAYASTRCVRYMIMVIVPCYYSSVTTTQVSHMRTMLHDSMNQVNIGQVDRRRVKALFQLTRENEFAYAIWGVIRLNMSLPLSYLSLCITYLVIISQFGKFID